MKLARQKELLRFFRWLAGYSAKDLPDNLLGRMLLDELQAMQEQLHRDYELRFKRH